MAVGALLRYAREALFSKPSADRELAKLARKHRVRRIVELGVASVERTEALLKAVGQSDADGVTYCGVDRFEQRGADEPALSLIDAHRVLSGLGESVRLAPGELRDVLPTIANTLADSDLIVLPSSEDDLAGETVWFYLPRMCHPGTLVVQLDESDSEAPVWRQWPLAEIEARAVAARSGPERLRSAA